MYFADISIVNSGVHEAFAHVYYLVIHAYIRTYVIIFFGVKFACSKKFNFTHTKYFDHEKCQSTVYSINKITDQMYALPYIILVTVSNMKPKEAFQLFENELLSQLPADQPKFIELLEKEGVISGGAKKKLSVNYGNKPGCCAAIILMEVENSDEKFYKLLSVMKEYNHSVKMLAQKIENNLDPGTYMHMQVIECRVSMYSLVTNTRYICYMHTYLCTHV